MTATWIKICGLTSAEDAALAAALEVDALGVVLWPGSPRAVSAEQAGEVLAGVPARIARIGVFVSPTPAEVARAAEVARLGALQLYAVDDVTPFTALGWPILWAASFETEATPAAPPGTTLLLDAHDPVRHGGTGRTVNWPRAAAIARTTRLVLAGGLTADNVAEAIATVQPYGVDVSSGVESSPGRKSEERLRRFVDAVRLVTEVRE